MPLSRFPPEVKAQVIAEWMAGSSLNQLSREHGVSKTTVQGWVKGLDRVQPDRSTEPKNNPLAVYDLDRMAVNLVDASSRSLLALLVATEDPTWIKRFSPADAAIFAGVVFDKLTRLLGAIRTDRAEPESAIVAAGSSEDS